MKILLVDDHKIIRDGLRAILEKQEGMEVVGEAADGHEAIALLRVVRPSVAIMDVTMPGLNGIETTRRIAGEFPDVKVIGLSMNADRRYVLAMLSAGAVGYLLKNATPDEIRDTVERAAAGEPMLSGEIAGRVLREFERERDEERYREQLAGLTAREEEILKLLATGESNREIGRRLFISEQTVKNHVASIFRKLQVNDRTKAAVLALKLGLGSREPR